MNGTCKAFRRGQAEGNYRVLHEVEQGTQLTARFWDNVEDSSTSYGRRKETVMKEEKREVYCLGSAGQGICVLRPQIFKQIRKKASSHSLN